MVLRGGMIRTDHPTFFYIEAFLTRILCETGDAAYWNRFGPLMDICLVCCILCSDEHNLVTVSKLVSARAIEWLASMLALGCKLLTYLVS